MARIAVVFESKYGQSAKIAEYVADMARRRGHEVKIVHASLAIDLDFDDRDAFVVVAPIYVGKHHRGAEAFVRARADLLSRNASVLLSVSCSAASADRVKRANVARIAHEFAEQTGARFRQIETVAGAIAYPKYSFFVRWMMKRISKKEGGPLDTSRIHELTDWAALDRAMTRFFAAFPPVHRELAHAS
jgi:menaquinone-dependent protoporphyrinogen oxidase